MWCPEKGQSKCKTGVGKPNKDYTVNRQKPIVDTSSTKSIMPGEGLSVSFTINHKPYTANSTVPPDTTLNDFIRNYAHLKGTKYLCQEGGCGTCVVAVRSKDQVEEDDNVRSVNSCLVSVFSCDGWEITTVEGLGNKTTGYHPVQARLAQFNGTQCGFCSAGMVMNMYSIQKANPNITMQEIEDSFGGNICRCTGYRPILEAFKSFASDVSPEIKQKCADIEELYPVKLLNGKSACCQNCPNGKCAAKSSNGTSPVLLKLNGTDWYIVSSLNQLYQLLGQVGSKSYCLVAGNTGRGIFKNDGPYSIFIDINNVKELKKTTTTPKLSLGASTTLTEMIAFLHEKSKLPGYFYTSALAQHVEKVAQIPVRNLGTIAGNLMMKHAHNDFPSDIFVILEAVGAKVNIGDISGTEKAYSLIDFLKENMQGRVITSITLPMLSNNHHVQTHKVMRRRQNTHAFVNAGFMVCVEGPGNFKIAKRPSIVIGAINAKFNHAEKTETFLEGKDLSSEPTLKAALEILAEEIQPEYVLPDPSPEYKRTTALGLFYKFVISVLGDRANSRLKSGTSPLFRPLSSAQQTFETDKSQWPITQPIRKLEAMAQCSGEAQYVNDLPNYPGELHAAFVISSIGSANLDGIDASEALKLPGVVAFYSAKDIPGYNVVIKAGQSFDFVEDEELFSSGKVIYAGQPLGIIVAETERLAKYAVKFVNVKYKDIQKPVLTVKDALKKAETHPEIFKVDPVVQIGELKDAEPKATRVIKGEFELGAQFHFPMEPQSCVCVPTEDGMDVFPATQWMDHIQNTIANLLQVKLDVINVQVRRVGGSFGSKHTRSAFVAGAAAVAASKLNRPVRLIMDLTSNIEVMGKRPQFLTKYEAGIDDSGKLRYVKLNIVNDLGCTFNESYASFMVMLVQSTYACDSWTVETTSIKTNTPSSTYCRAPGTMEGIAMIENVIEHVAREVGKDVWEVRMINMLQPGSLLLEGGKPFTGTNHIPDMWTELQEKCDFAARKQAIDVFNKENRWKKRGISAIPMKYPTHLFGPFNCLVSIYWRDGSVAVAHAGVEQGQGINTKVAQVVARELGIPLDMVSIKPANNLTAPNAMTTAGSIGSEINCFAAAKCCKELVRRMAPLKEKLGGNPTWQQLTMQCFMDNVNLCVVEHFAMDKELSPYTIWGVTATEVEVDLLTGEMMVLRADIMEEVGNSISPEIDIGQIEGSYVFGLGYWITEKIVYCPDTGKLMTNSTWDYKPPGAKDIPADFRIYFKNNDGNPTGVYGSKATGEPPVCMSCSAFFAVRAALDSARADAGVTGWFQMNGPITPEDVLFASLTHQKHFSL